METRQFEYFLAVAEDLSFTKAAQRLYAVQSTVSAAIKSLEAELGTALFTRSTRSVTLTSAGLAFLPEARAALDAVDRAVSVVQEASTGLRGTIRFGTMTSVPAPDLPTLLGEFHRAYPLVNLHIQVSFAGSTGLAEDLRHSRLDVALLGLAEADMHDFDTTLVEIRPFLAVLPRTHPLAHRRAIALSDLRGEIFVDGPPGFGSRIAADRAFAAAGVSRRVGVEVSDTRTVPEYVRAGLGIAVSPDWNFPDLDGVVLRELTGTDLHWRLSLATLAGRRPSRAVQTLLDLINQRRPTPPDTEDHGLIAL
jgi:DNA-binding transcriptional LysR family regulator